MKNEVATTQTHGQSLYRVSTDAASLCKEIVVATAKNIQGRKYVQVEGWQAIAIAHGCVASSKNVERIEGGIRAIGFVTNISTGQEISTAEGFVGDDEKVWVNRPEYAKRAMAQTRSISRACRSAFAHVVVMMNAGLQTTPAEEIPEEGFAEETAAPRSKKQEVLPPEKKGDKPQFESMTDQAKAYAQEIELADTGEKLDLLIARNSTFMGKLASTFPKWHEKLLTLLAKRRDELDGNNVAGDAE